MTVFDVPNELKLQTKNTYMKFYNQLTGCDLVDNSQEQSMDVNMYNGDYAESFFIEKSDIVGEEVDFFFQKHPIPTYYLQELNLVLQLPFDPTQKYAKC